MKKKKKKECLVKLENDKSTPPGAYTANGSIKSFS